jgi:hypothetical protein
MLRCHLLPDALIQNLVGRSIVPLALSVIFKAVDNAVVSSVFTFEGKPYQAMGDGLRAAEPLPGSRRRCLSFASRSFLCLS